MVAFRTRNNRSTQLACRTKRSVSTACSGWRLCGSNGQDTDTAACLYTRTAPRRTVTATTHRSRLPPSLSSLTHDTGTLGKQPESHALRFAVSVTGASVVWTQRALWPSATRSPGDHASQLQTEGCQDLERDHGAPLGDGLPLPGQPVPREQCAHMRAGLPFAPRPLSLSLCRRALPSPHLARHRPTPCPRHRCSRSFLDGSAPSSFLHPRPVRLLAATWLPPRRST